jgi:hypothetical protein
MEQITKNQGDALISLLGRVAFPEEKLIDFICKNKRNPLAYIRGYNACNGKNTISEIAKIIGVSQPTLTPILQEWESAGIIYETESSIGKAYCKLYKLPLPKEKKAQKNMDEKNRKEVNVENESVKATTREDNQKNGPNDLSNA